MLVEQFQKLKLFGQGKKQRHPTKLKYLNGIGVGAGLQFLCNGVGRTQILLPDNAGLAVYPSAFNQVVVGFALDDFFDQASHS